MFAKKVLKKARSGLIVIRRDGFLAFLVLALQKLQYREQSLRNRRKHEIFVRAKYRDVLAVNLDERPPAWAGTDRKKLRINWIMNPPGKGSGGHMTIYRFLNALEKAGHDCRIYLYSVHDKAKISDVQLAMGNSFPKVKAKMQWLKTPEAMEPADALIATSWETAYPTYLSKMPARRFYFIQDFEPLFYPMGSMYVLTENTYRMGYYGVTAGGWLAKKMTTEYGMQAEHFDFGADPHLYSHKNKTERKQILYYARPETERRGWELAVMVLELFHRRHPDYTINIFGADVSSFRLPFPYKNLKILEHEQLGELYNRCAAGLVMSLTNMSLLPLELLACGTIPVVNAGENNTLVSDNPFIAYAQPNPQALANKLSEVVSRPDLTEHALAASDSVKDSSWTKSYDKIVGVIERETRRADG